MIPNDDTFISDEEEEYCPLCVEEMDISDKNFKPCPCGYQICQFCYNNIRQNPELNGRCPGCRRLYDDESVEYKTISAEEYRLQQLKKEKREREKKQREKEKKETEMANKKHLAGLRVVQKNLVYVTGLNPPCNPDDLHSVLRSDKYFGQYGKISKIVINRKTPNPSSSHHHHQSPGLVVYVTFVKKEDALKCINELDGSLCDGRILRAAHGTTKYCSSYLRGHPCPNPNCMFLHEPGEEADSYTRKDLSTQQGIKMSMMGMSGSRVNSNSNIQNSSATNTNSNSQHSGDEGSNSQNDDNSEYDQDQIENISQTNNIPVLPATASWAKTSASASPSVTNNTNLANAASFPTLGEIFKDQKSQRKDKLKLKSSKSSKDNLLLPDDIDIDDSSAIDFARETAENLKSLFDRKGKLEVHFKNMDTNDGKTLPLFSFDKSARFSNDTKVEEERLVARQIIEKFVLRQLKNYHLAYQNHPIAQQQSLLQAQLQQSQLQQSQVQHQTPNMQNPQVNLDQNDQQQQHQLLLLQLQQQAQSHSSRQYNPQQQQPVPASNQNGTPSQIQAQMNLLKLNERNSNTSTPPPPGLFVPSGQKNVPTSQNQNPYTSSVTSSTSNQGGATNPSSSSQLLTQLMSGKK